MSSGGRPGGGVSERHRGSDRTRKHRVAQAPGFTRRAAINPSGVLNELTDGTVCSVDAATEAELGRYRKSRLKQAFNCRAETAASRHGGDRS